MTDEKEQRRRLVRGYDRARFHEAARQAFALEDARGTVPEGVTEAEREPVRMESD